MKWSSPLRNKCFLLKQKTKKYWTIYFIFLNQKDFVLFLGQEE